MAKYLLASASGMGFLCLITGLSPVQALPSLEIADKNVAVNQDDGSYQKNDSHQSDLANNISSKLLIANESQKKLSSVNQKSKNQNLEVDSAVSFWQPIIQESASSSPSSYKLAQVTSVSQLSDVQPTDWAFQALQSLVERYGCIAGYPNQTYRGNRAMTRYEFAAGLNACLERINELIATATGDLVKKEDLATLQKLQEQFAAELATLRGRVDAVEARTAELEANQFSTTTKLNGEVIIAGVGASGGAPNDSDPNIILVNRVRFHAIK
jgi:Carbohydrate-selective porin, OprB family/S-layer homology domain